MAAQASNEWTSLPGELPTPKGGFGTSTQSNTPQEHPMTSQVCDYIFVCFQRFWEGPKLSRQKRPRDRMIDTATTMQYTMSTSEKNSASYYSSSSLKSRKQGFMETCIAMFAKTLLTIAKRWKQPNVHRWMTEQTDCVSLHLHIMEHQATFKRQGIPTHAMLMWLT